MYYIPYHRDLNEFARMLRNNSTLGEILLWHQLRAGKIKGYRFNRQKPIGRYIVDFYCYQLQLVIEVDGGYHYEYGQMLLDRERQIALEKMKLHFLRFHDEEVKKDMDQVLNKVYKFIEQRQVM